MIKAGKKNFTPFNRAFSNRLYKDLTTRELIVSYFILKMCKFNFFIDNIEPITKFAQRVLGDRMFFGLLKSTMGNHFTAGESVQEANQTIKRFKKTGFQVAMGYMAEFSEETESERIFDETANMNIETLRLNKQAQDPVFFFAIKFTGLIRLKLLSKMNKNQEMFKKMFSNRTIETPETLIYESFEFITEKIRQVLPHRSPEEIKSFLNLIPKLSASSSKKEEINLIEWNLGCNAWNLINPTLNDNPIWRELTNYTEEEMVLISYFVGRLNRILSEMRVIKSFLLIDAEQSFVQSIIDNITEQIMYQENYQQKRLSVFNTVQNYLQSSECKVNYEISKKYFFGLEYPILFKMVRGAYHKEEIGIEKKTGNQIVFSNIEETHLSYNKNCLKIIAHMCNNSRLLVASHNENSVEIMSSQIENHSKREMLTKGIFFGTLLGLNDKLAYKCLAEGKTTIKYMPFGDRRLTLPYMIRRCYEAKDLIQKNSDQTRLYRLELRKRWFRF